MKNYRAVGCIPASLLFFPLLQIRNWVHEQKGKLLRIRPEDEEYVKQRTAELAAKVELGAKQTGQDKEKETVKS